MFLLLAGCTAPPAELPTHTLAFAGDVTLGRAVNPGLFDDQARSQMLGGLPWLHEADLALVNAEGVISGGGWFFDKGESRPYTYRAHPNAMDMLAEAGIDVLAVGNNHALDYGPAAFVEMLDRTLMAGMGYVGGGENLKDAKAPHYELVGDTVVAFIGGDLTYTEPHGATKDRAGTFWLPGLKPKKRQTVINALKGPLKEARQNADLVFYTPHWGDNWKETPTDHIRALATGVIGLGFDGILGHSAHLVQGVEIIDGKPVIYDAGNILSDYPPPGDHRRSMVFELTFTRAGVTGVMAHPVRLHANQSKPAAGNLGAEVLDSFAKASLALGTTVEVGQERAVIRCSPGDLRPRKREPAFRAAPATPRLAPANLILDALPEEATPTNIVWENGIRLVGYEVLMPELRVPKAGNVVTLYFTSETPQSKDVWVDLKSFRSTGGMDFADHLPGDWILPADKWPMGKIIRDETLVRHTGEAKGSVTLKLALREGSKRIAIVEGAQDDPTTLTLAETPYVKGAPKLWGPYEKRRLKRQ